MSVENKSSYSDRLIEALKAQQCPEQYIEVVKTFVVAERKVKDQYMEANRGIISFGKYKGKNVNDVFKLDKSYCQWMMNKQSSFLRADLKEILTELLK